MTDLVRHQPAAISTFEIANDAWILAQKIAPTEFVPEALRNKPDAVLACILAGHEAGISPMQALSKIYIVKGKPSMSAELMRALVLAQGHELTYPEMSSTKVTASGRRSNAKDQPPTVITWTMDDARRAGVLGKDTWKAYPMQMLAARATSILCRLVFPDVLAGISYTPEEIEDGFDDDRGSPLLGSGDTPTAAATPAGNKRRASRTAARSGSAAGELTPPPPAPAGELPDLPDDDEPTIEAQAAEVDPAPLAPIDPPDEHPAPETWPAGEWQQGDWDDVPPPPLEGKRYTGPQIIAIKLAELFDIKGSGADAREERLAAIRHLVGRDDIASSKDLSSQEYESIIATLDNWPADEPLYDADDTPVDPPEPGAVEPSAPPVAPTPRPTPPTAATVQRQAAPADPTAWSQDDWRIFLKSRGIKVTALLAEARRIGADHTPPVAIATLDDIAGSPLALELVGWAEEQAEVTS